MSDWDAERYHRISAPQFDWGQRVIARLKPAAGERILDLGCGTGKLTQEIAAAVRGGLVVGLDRSGAMLAVARVSDAGRAGARAPYVQATGTLLPFRAAFDAVFSAATLHWIHDHASVFRDVFTALTAGGRLVAQCGGRGNLERLFERAATLMAAPRFAPHFRGWRDPWYFADAGTTAGELRQAGFVGVETWIEAAPADLQAREGYAEFIACVCIRHQLERLPLDLRDPFVEELTSQAAGDSPPFVLDYQRLNITAWKAAP